MLLRNLSLDVIPWVAASIVIAAGILLFGASRISSRLIQARGVRLPSPLRERLLEEWQAELDALSRPFDKLRFAIAIALTRRTAFLDADATAPSTKAIAAVGEVVVSVDDVHVYTGFGSRLSALIADGILSGIVSMTLTALVAWNSRVAYSELLAPRTPLNLLILFIVGVTCLLVFQVYCVVRFAGSPGKLLLGMRIVTMDGSPLTVRHALLRTAPNLVTSSIQLGMLLLLLVTSPSDVTIQQPPDWWTWTNAFWSFASLVWFVGEINVFFASYERRALHDLIAGTVVVFKVPRVVAPTDFVGPSGSTSSFR